MLTYNHEEYISDAIEGVLMQKTKFKFELIIGEDRSNDKTAEICRSYRAKYSNIINLRLNNKNVGMLRNFFDILQYCSGKYIALCEGDDYWTDPFKLQKQVEFLEANTEYALIHTDKCILKNNLIHPAPTVKINSGFIFEDLLLCQFISNLTVLVRSDVLKNSYFQLYPIINDRKWLMGDYPLWLDISKNHKIAYLNEVTGVYRFLDESASHSFRKEKSYLFVKSILNIRKHFYKLYIQSLNNNNYSFKIRYYEMKFHSEKRMILDFGILAKKELASILFTNPIILIYIFSKGIAHVFSKNWRRDD